MRFEDRAVLVTGGGSGIGREVALHAAREGAILAVGDIDVEMAQRTIEDIAGEGGRGHAFALDVTSAEAAGHFVDAAGQAIGRLDVLVNSAGIREIAPVLELSFEEWNRVLQVNASGVFLCSQAFAAAVVEAGGAGAIVNLASTLGVQAAPNRVAYTASKHAVVGITKAMGMELAGRNIRVNAVGPGVTRTPLTECYFQDAETVERIRGLHAMGRWGEPAEIAKAILFLASDDASFITGTTLLVDGGWTAGKPI